MRLSFITAVGS